MVTNNQRTKEGAPGRSTRNIVNVQTILFDSRATEKRRSDLKNEMRKKVEKKERNAKIYKTKPQENGQHS